MDKMHKDEVIIDIDLVAQLIAKQFPHLAHLLIKPVISSGTDNAIYRLGEDMVIRLPRIKNAALHVDKEYKWLPILSKSVSLPIPIPIAKGSPDYGYPWSWLIYKWIEGDDAIHANLELEKAAITLGNFILDLHKVDITNAPHSGRGYRYLSSLHNEVQDALNVLGDMIDVDAASDIWKKVLDFPKWNGIPMWIHSDLHEGNILVNDGEISAIIDFGMVGIGDPACDMMVAWTLLDSKSRNIFRSIVKVDDATWERGKGFALSFGLIALPYYKHTNPVLADIALRTINEILRSSYASTRLSTNGIKKN